MGKKLHVGNLTYSVTHTNLEEWFAQYGTVQSAQVITDRDTGRSKGFGFVEMDTDAQAQAAILGLHDQDHDGRRLTVDEAKPRVARTSSGGYGGGGGAEVLIVHQLDRFRGDHSCGPSIHPVPPMSRDFLPGHGFRGLSPAGHVSLNHSPNPAQSRRNESSAIPPSTREQISFREPSTAS